MPLRPSCPCPLLMMAAPASAATADPRRGRTSSSSSPTTWASPTSAATAARSRTPEPRRARGRRAAVHPVLQHRPLLPDPGQPAHRPLPAPGRRRPHDGGPRAMTGYRGDLNRRVRHHRRGAQAGRLPHLRRRQVARHPSRRPGRPEAQLAAAARVRPLLRHDQRRRQLLRPVHPRPRQHPDLARSPTRSTSRRRTTTPTRSPTTPSGSSASTPRTTATSRSSCTSPTPPPTGRCTRCRRTSRSTRASTTPATSRSARPGSRRPRSSG